MTEQTAIQMMAARFRRFAEVECPGRSPLYQRLATEMADDADLMALAAEARPGQPTPNLFFAAAQYLLQAAPTEPLARFYLAAVAATPPDGDP